MTERKRTLTNLLKEFKNNSSNYYQVFPLVLLMGVMSVGISIMSEKEADEEPVNMPDEAAIVEYNNPLNDAEETEAVLPPLNELVNPFETLGPVTSILISQRGELIAEEYFRGMHADRTHNIKSASKSILSILTGIAIDQGYLEGVDQKISDFFPEYFEKNPDSIKASITIGDLLTMRSGLATTSRNHYGDWVTSNNWIHYALDRPLRGTPGEDRIYSTGNTHLLGVALARATGMSALEFANRYLFNPLDIRIGGWDRDPQGYYLGGNNMALRPKDLIKVGQLMMNAGLYNNEQIVSKDWIVNSIEPVTGRGNRLNYGYLWFRRMAGNYHMVYAFGHGGQYLMILPELEAIISVTTRIGNESTRSYRRDLFSSIDQEIIPWLETAYVSGMNR